MKSKGGFTMPGEAGYEELTLKLADKWGADVIRDSDGTELSPEITEAGYGIYSTICIIRDHNEWAEKNPDKLQQTFLISEPQTAIEHTLRIPLLKGYYKEQFKVNDSEEALRYYQVFDRTANREVPAQEWSYDKAAGTVLIKNCELWHKYTVNFLAYRIWEEISMYNHVTNKWNKEHLMPIDPRYPQTRAYMREWLEKWCMEHPATTVVRFTSLFYNFVWIWGEDERNRSLFTDWGSYDFTVSPAALKEFEQKYGYQITSEDFINQGKFQVSHMPPSERKKDWMNFINEFVVGFGRELVDIVHRYGKKAYVFYDDSWVGLEPYKENFEEFGFDGIIKCVFSGFEVRLCAGVKTKTHEIRLHPYLFPVGLGGAPTFMEGGNPKRDAQEYWVHVRRALLRAPIQRIGLGGYIHLVEDYPDFCDYMEQISDEFREIRELLEKEKAQTLKTKVAVLHSWGKVRSWTLSGHFHETDQMDLIHINEALAGLPVDVDFLDFKDIREGKLAEYRIIINAGFAGSAWSGGDNWKDEAVVSAITKWVYEGGHFLGVGEPSAVPGYDTFFRMAHVLGVDKDTGAKICHGKWSYELKTDERLSPYLTQNQADAGIYLLDKETSVYKEINSVPAVTIHQFGQGKGIYLSQFRFDSRGTRLLWNLILDCEEKMQLPILDNELLECALFRKSGKILVINNSDTVQEGNLIWEGRIKKIVLDAYEMKEIDLNVAAEM